MKRITRVSVNRMDLCQTHCKQVPNFFLAPGSGQGHVVSLGQSQPLLIKSKSIQVASSNSLPTGRYGLCFGYCFSGLFPLRSHFNSPPFMVCFRESLVLIDYTQKSTRSTLALKLSVAPPMGDCHKLRTMKQLQGWSHIGSTFFSVCFE